MPSCKVNSFTGRPSGPRSPEPGRASHENTTGCSSTNCSRPSSRSVSKVPSTSSGPISAHKARSRVVFPSPCCPETTIDNRALTAAARNDASRGLTVSRPTRSSRVMRTRRCRRITTLGRWVTNADAARRAPSRFRWRSGLASENTRGGSALEARSCSSWISSSSDAATGGPGTFSPSTRSRKTRSWPTTMMFSTSARSTKGCSRPSPNIKSKTACAKASCALAELTEPWTANRASVASWTTSMITARPSSWRDVSSTNGDCAARSEKRLDASVRFRRLVPVHLRRVFCGRPHRSHLRLAADHMKRGRRGRRGVCRRQGESRADAAWARRVNGVTEGGEQGHAGQVGAFPGWLGLLRHRSAPALARGGASSVRGARARRDSPNATTDRGSGERSNRRWGSPWDHQVESSRVVYGSR